MTIRKLTDKNRELRKELEKIKWDRDLNSQGKTYSMPPLIRRIAQLFSGAERFHWFG